MVCATCFKKYEGRTPWTVATASFTSHRNRVQELLCKTESFG